jgi:hypothetical protein
MLQNLTLIDTLPSAYWEKRKNKEKKPPKMGAFFPWLDTLLAVLHGIFVTVMCN